MLLESVMHHWAAWSAGGVAALLLMTFLATSLQSMRAMRDSSALCSPPIHPYWIPFLGHTVEFVRDTGGFVDRISHRYGKNIPIHVVLGPVRGYILSGTESISALLRATRSVSPKPFMALVMQNMFGTPDRAMPLYLNDDSGTGPTPISGTNVRPELRIYHHQHLQAHRFLTGEALRRLTERFMETLSGDLHTDTTIGADQWVEGPDFFVFWKNCIFRAAVKALFGSHLLSLNPSFEVDFWEYVDATPTLAKGVPKWLVPKAYAARDRVIAAIKRWHRFAAAHSDYRENGSDKPDWDEYWGSSWLKSRQQFGRDTGILDDDALASEDLALMIDYLTDPFSARANANAILAAVWFLLHIHSDADLDRRLQPELERGLRLPRSSDSPLQFDLATLMESPLIQSIYAEVLRLRVALVINRTPVRSDFRLGRWTVPRDRFIVFSTQVAAQDPQAWGPERTQHGTRPLDQFWADRFLTPDEKAKEGQKRQFSLDGLSGAWIPYGGGSFMCPGRHFAKQEMIGSVAVFQAYFELELRDREPGHVPEPDEHFYGVGVMPPKGEIPFRIRRRRGVIRT
ncbi:cytochrome P450 [Aspergillus cavernicola]|uniref:Cytochrome P450 n=1 Tax=Aspergillus cavernicola TaxID=176166 RepID=A0ABR4IP43_9EURO